MFSCFPRWIFNESWNKGLSNVSIFHVLFFISSKFWNFKPLYIFYYCWCHRAEDALHASGRTTDVNLESRSFMAEARPTEHTCDGSGFTQIDGLPTRDLRRVQSCDASCFPEPGRIGTGVWFFTFMYCWKSDCKCATRELMPLSRRHMNFIFCK